MASKQKILIADDSEMNRAILAEMLQEEYEILEVEDGSEAVAALQKYGSEISLLLLDIVMPKMDGFAVLETMNRQHWIDDVPVVMISSESASSRVERAYDLGAADFISRPFDARVVHRRVVNTILLYSKQKKLIDLVMEQVYEREKQNGLMVDILSHIVEFRNGESGLHVLHIRTLTELLLKHLNQMTDQYRLTSEDIGMISLASALHDIGKISIPSAILNKPGRLTGEEFAVMKTHSAAGAGILEKLPFHQNEPLVRTAYAICRWHHERYDGRGYPDGLKGDEIPIAAQIVALSDVYDALTSRRVYKEAIPHEKAVRMIMDGECGAFHPLLLRCLRENAEEIRDAMVSGTPQLSQREVRKVTEELLRREELTASDRTLQMLEHERIKNSFFAAMSGEIQFEYTAEPEMITLSSWGADRLGLPETVVDPRHNRQLLDILGEEGMNGIVEAIRHTTPSQPITQYDCQAKIRGELRWVRFICRTTWLTEAPLRCTGAIGKAVDIHEERKRLNTLAQEASHDALTGLLNHKYARAQILERLKNPDSHFALAVLDLDQFKSVNDTYGHMFGDEVLVYSAKRLRRCVRSDDIVARIGGDEFLIFIEYQKNLEMIIDRIFSSLISTYKGFRIAFSMGVARTEEIGRNYDTLFRAADQALYAAKRSGAGRYCFHSGTMQWEATMVSRIEEVGKTGRAEKEEETPS